MKENGTSQSQQRNLRCEQNELLLDELDGYLDKNIDQMMHHLDALVRVESVFAPDQACFDAPFGPGPKQALDVACDIARDLGFPTGNCDGYAAFADYPLHSREDALRDSAKKQEEFCPTDALNEEDARNAPGEYVIVAHVDVVPAGEGWGFPPYQLTSTEGFLVGRGVADDKGALVAVLHACNFWRQRGRRFPHSLRVLFGANEEEGMADVAHYLSVCDPPRFAFTPDGQFPVCYGEKGCYDGIISSAGMPDGRIIDIEAGDVVNAVPGKAHALLRISQSEAGSLPAYDGITIEWIDDETLRVNAIGRAAHAATPEEGLSALRILADYLVDSNLLAGDEKAFFRFLCDKACESDGSGVGLATHDDDFGNLTLVCGMIEKEQQHYVVTVDCRYPRGVTGQIITECLQNASAQVGATCSRLFSKDPLFVDPCLAEMRALLSAYRAVSGDMRPPFVSGGITYASEFPYAVSFGPKKPQLHVPDWVGTPHGPNEALSEELFKESFKVYALAIKNLMEL